jgi:type II secretory pathway component GspD/PulD (secretin)
MTRIQTLAGLTLAFALTCAAHAQTPTTDTTDCSKLPTRVAATDCQQAHVQVKIIDLKYASQQNDANEILVAVRNIADPSTKVYLVASQNAIVVATYPVAIAHIEDLVHSLDRPKPTYRLTFTITDFDGAAKTGTRHFSLVEASGQRVTLKQGNKVPVVTGKYDAGTSSAETQNTYLDVGMNFDVTVNPYADGLMMKSKIEQSSVAKEISLIGPHDPIVHQTVIEGVSTLAFGKPSVLGALDVPDSTKRMEISVVAEALP